MTFADQECDCEVDRSHVQSLSHNCEPRAVFHVITQLTCDDHTKRTQETQTEFHSRHNELAVGRVEEVVQGAESSLLQHLPAHSYVVIASFLECVCHNSEVNIPMLLTACGE